MNIIRHKYVHIYANNTKYIISYWFHVFFHMSVVCVCEQMLRGRCMRKMYITQAEGLEHDAYWRLAAVSAAVSLSLALR